MVRIAESSDVDAMVELAEARRRQYQLFQPVFWRKAENSEQLTRSFFSELICDPQQIALVFGTTGSVEGFLTARETPAPPVYAPGGATFTVDDFCVADPSLWLTVGQSLLRRLAEIGQSKGWGQLVVVCADLDHAKAELLQTAGLSIASNWWTCPIPSSLIVD
jgi:hypothetical protein